MDDLHIFCPYKLYKGPFHTWLVVSTVSTPLKNMKVSWDVYSRYMEKCSKAPTRYACMGHKQAPSKCWPWQRHRRKRRGSCCCASQARNTVKYQCLCSETRDSPNETTYRAVMHPRWMSTSSTTPMCVSKKCLKGNSKLETTILRVKTNHFSACWCFFQTNHPLISKDG